MQRELTGSGSCHSPPYRLRQSGLSSLACASFSSSATPSATLRRNVIVPLTAVSRLFPDITRETSTGRNLTATGDPKATRMVIYAIDAGSKKATITVDQYRSRRDASSAYQQAVQKSQSVPGFKLILVANLGQQTFAGTVTIDAETHIGLGVLDDKLIVGATLAGYDATPTTQPSSLPWPACKLSPQRGPWVPAVSLVCLAHSRALGHYGSRCLHFATTARYCGGGCTMGAAAARISSRMPVCGG